MQHLDRIDANLRLDLSVHSMKVWRRMILVEHSDDDPEEPTNFWHRKTLVLEGRKARRGPFATPESSLHYSTDSPLPDSVSSHPFSDGSFTSRAKSSMFFIMSSTSELK